MQRLLLLAWMALTIIPTTTRAQDAWVGIGAIGGTAMFMDTSSVVRAGSTRKVWIRSVDSEPKLFLAGRDTLSFDTVLGLNEFDCARETRTVRSVQYLLRGEAVLGVADTHEKPVAVRPGSFFAAVLRDLCREEK